MDQRWAVCACERHGGRDRQAPGRLDTPEQGGIGWAPRERIQVAPCFAMCPTPCGPCGRDVPAPSIAARPRPANRGRPAFPVSGRRAARLRDVHDVGTTTHPKADVVVTVVGRVVVAVGSATVVRIVVPGTAAQHTGQVSGRPTGSRLHFQYGPRGRWSPKNAGGATRRPVVSGSAIQRPAKRRPADRWGNHDTPESRRR